MRTLIKNSDISKVYERGFTLIEMSISMIIIGLLLASFVPIYQQHIEEQRSNTTDDNVVRVGDFLEEYRKANGEYPCPAPMKAATNSPYYGRSVDCQGDPAYVPATLTPGNCTADGICMESTIATRVAALTDPHVIVGTVPFRDLQIDEDTSMDGYGSRMLYAVTYSMTDRDTFDFENGAISIVDENGSARVLPDGSVDYLVISPGKTGVGGYNREGVLTANCAGATLETRNCNPGFESGTGPNDAIYVAALRSTASNAGFYDDVMVYSNPNTLSPWKRTENDLEDVESLVPDNVGVGTDTPTKKLVVSSTAPTTPSLRVSGINGNDGRVLTSQICDAAGNCFEPRNIAGDNTSNPMDGTKDDGMKCPPGQYMVGIEDGAAACSPDITVRCPSSTPVLKGINADGTLDCTTIPLSSCPADPSRTQCAAHPTSADISLPAAADGTLTSWIPAGDCHEQRYLCVNGAWTAPGGSSHRKGSCTDSPATVTTPSCASIAGYSGGTYTITGATTCTGGTNTLTTDCTCVGRNRNQNCPGCDAGYAATVSPLPTHQEEQLCVGNVLSNSWTDVPGAAGTCPAKSTYCQCILPAVLVKWENADCPANYVSDSSDPYEVKWVFDEPTCQWEKTTDFRGSCICDPDPVRIPVAHSCTTCQIGTDGYNDFDRDPSTCTATGMPLPSSVAPTCAPKQFYWRDIGNAVGSPNPSSIAYDVGESCDCNNDTQANCLNSSNVPRYCKCDP